MSTKCITPYYVKDKHSIDKIPVPCSKCPPCIKRRTSGWSYRLVKEGEISNTALFVTLTYNTDSVPITQKGFMNLDKTHVQKFMKRLRKLTNEKIKYYAVGEYGSIKMRPHYHLILFNADSEKINRAWALNNHEIGTIYIGSVNEASIGYTLKYMSKKGKIPMHKNDDRQKEFSLMSKGLGKNYITENMIKWHKNILNERMYIPMKDGKKIAMPRYYKDKIYNEKEKTSVAESIKLLAETQLQKDMQELGTDYHSIMAERHIHAFNKMHKKATQNEKL
jgi:hypothetical protein